MPLLHLVAAQVLEVLLHCLQEQVLQLECFYLSLSIVCCMTHHPCLKLVPLNHCCHSAFAHTHSLKFEVVTRPLLSATCQLHQLDVPTLLSGHRQGLRAVKEGRVAIVDGNQMFARPGPRLVDALEFLVGLLHNRPNLIPQDFPWTWWDTKPAHTAMADNAGVPQAASSSPASQTARHDMAACNGAPAHAQIATHSNQAASDGQSELDSSSDRQDAASVQDAVVSNDGAEPAASLLAQQDSQQTQQRSQSASEAQHSQPGTQHAQRGAQQAQHGAQQATQASTHLQQTGTPSPQATQASKFKVHLAKERQWRAAPYLGPEIEEAHATAIAAGQSTYTDPATGYKVALFACLGPVHLV